MTVRATSTLQVYRSSASLSLGGGGGGGGGGGIQPEGGLRPLARRACVWRGEAKDWREKRGLWQAELDDLFDF